MLTWFIAHGSGIDDVLWFAVPAVIAIVVVRRAEKKAVARHARASQPDGAGDEPLSSAADE